MLPRAYLRPCLLGKSAMQALVGDPCDGPDTAPAQSRGTGIPYSGSKPCLRLSDKFGSFADYLERCFESRVPGRFGPRQGF